MKKLILALFLLPLGLAAQIVNPGTPQPLHITVSGAAEVDLTGCISSAYTDYDIRLDKLTVATTTSAGPITMQYFVGGAWDATAADYQAAGSFAQTDGAGASAFTNQNTTPGFAFRTAGDNASSYYSGTIRLRNVGAGTSQDATYDTLAFTAGAHFWWSGADHFVPTTNAITNIRFIIPSGGTLTGTVICQPLN